MSDPPAITTIFMGPLGVGKSALLSAVVQGPLGSPFRLGSWISTGWTTCERYTDVDGKMYIDTPALGVERQQQQAVLEALNQGGIFRVVFVVNLMSVRVQPGDVAMMSLLHQAVPAIGSNYSIVINKASAAVMSASRDNKSAIQNNLQEGLPPTSYFYYFPFFQSWDSPNCDHRAFAGSADFRNFIQHAPAVAIPHGSISIARGSLDSLAGAFPKLRQDNNLERFLRASDMEAKEESKNYNERSDHWATENPAQPEPVLHSHAFSRFDKGNLGTIGMNDLDISRAVCLGKGSNGCVNKVPVQDHFNSQVALKMMYNYSAGNSTESLNKWFSAEYIFVKNFPHWSLCNIYSFFHSKSLLDLIPADIRQNYCIVDDSGNFVEGCKDPNPTPVFSRTTYIVQELGLGNAEMFLTGQISRFSLSQQAIELTFCLMCACTHLNGNNCYHGDIKLSNILAVSRSRIHGNLWVLCDFGTVRECDSLGCIPQGQSQSLDGCPKNRSPEVIQPPQSPSTLCLEKNDVWAAGCVVYELITGMHPFDHNNNLDTNLILNLSLGQHQVPPNHRHHILSPLVGYLLERDPHIRPSAGKAMLVCGALIFLPVDRCASFLVPVATHQSVQEAIDLYSNNETVCSILLPIHERNVPHISLVSEAAQTTNTSTTTTTSASNNTTGECITTSEFLGLVFTNAALSDVPFFGATMVEFLKRIQSLLP